jgi:hypothetical protein
MVLSGSFNYISSGSFKQHVFPALLATHFVGDHMEGALSKKINFPGTFRGSEIYVFGGGSPRAPDADSLVCCFDGFFYTDGPLSPT